MQRKSFAGMECSIARALEEVGDGWSLLILRNALLGARRFQDFQEQLSAPPNTLARRLDTLTRLGLLSRRCYEQRPPRHCYDLTEKARDLAPVLLALAAWGDRWLSPEGAPLQCVDAATGRPIEAIVVDRCTLQPVEAGKVALRAGPGASRKLRRALPGQLLLGAAPASAGAAR